MPFTISWNLLTFMSTELVTTLNRLILFRPLLLLPSIFPSILVPLSRLFASRGQSIGASASVLPKNIQDRFPPSRHVPHILQGEEVRLKRSRTVCPLPVFCL